DRLRQYERDFNPLAVEGLRQSVTSRAKTARDKRGKLPTEHEYAHCHPVSDTLSLHSAKRRSSCGVTSDHTHKSRFPIQVPNSSSRIKFPIRVPESSDRAIRRSKSFTQTSIARCFASTPLSETCTPQPLAPCSFVFITAADITKRTKRGFVGEQKLRCEICRA
ncbi:MAG: hypothetical protein RL591_1488, partial [Planctomycetota bacterium]